MMSKVEVALLAELEMDAIVVECQISAGVDRDRNTRELESNKYVLLQPGDARDSCMQPCLSRTGSLP